MSFLFIYIIQFFSAFTLLAPATTVVDVESYCNGRYNFCVTYPDDYFDKKTVADNSDGLRLSSNDKQSELSISAAWNVLDQDLTSLYFDLLEGLTMEGKEITDDDYEIENDELVSLITLANDETIFLKVFNQKKFYVITMLSSKDKNKRAVQRIGQQIQLNIPNQ